MSDNETISLARAAMMATLPQQPQSQWPRLRIVARVDDTTVEVNAAVAATHEAVIKLARVQIATNANEAASESVDGLARELAFTADFDASELHAVLKAARLWVSNDASRPHLCGVYVEADPLARDSVACVVATNGHGMYCARIVSSCTIVGSVNLTVDTVDALISATKPSTRKHALPARVALTRELATLPSATVALRETGEAFPPWTRVIPLQRVAGAVHGLAIEYLKNALASFPAGSSVRIESTGDNPADPVIITGQTIPNREALLVLAPIRL